VIGNTNSIFGELHDVDLSSLQEELGDLFELKKGTAVVKKPTAGKEKVALISNDRNKNIAIRISQFRRMGQVALFETIEHMDPEKVLSVEAIEALLRCVPTVDELKILKEFTGVEDELDPTERFLMKVMRTKNFEGRLKVLRTARLFDYEAGLIKERSDVVTKACNEVLDSKHLGGVFELVLALGNTLNKKKTNGFRVGSLLKLVETKSNKGKITMLHYLASVMESRMSHLMEFKDELPTANEASGITVDAVATHFQQLQQIVHEATVGVGLVSPDVVERIAAGGDDLCSAPLDVKYATDFYIKANNHLASLEDDVQKMIDDSYRLQEYLSEKEMPASEILLVLDTFIKAFVHVLDDNARERRVATNAANKWKAKTAAGASKKKARTQSPQPAANATSFGEVVDDASKELLSAARQAKTIDAASHDLLQATKAGK